MVLKLQKSKWILFLGLILFFTILAILFNPAYQVRDDELMRSVISGNYTGYPDSHAVFMFCPLTVFLSTLYRLYGNIPWYSLFFALLFLISGYIILKEILFYEYKDKKDKLYMFFLSIIYILLLSSLFIVQQFTVNAAIVGSLSVFMTITKKKNIYIFFFFILCFWIRPDVFLMTCPFIIAAKLWTIVSEGSFSVKRTIYKIFPIIVITVSIFIIGNLLNSLNYNSVEWKKYSKYNSARSKIYDFTDIWSNDIYKEEIDQLDNRKLYNVIYNYDLLLDSSIDEDKLNGVLEIVNSHSPQPSFLPNIGRSIERFINVKICSKIGILWTVINIMLSILILYSLVKRKEWKRLLIFNLTLTGTQIMLFYLCFINRPIDRVLTALWFTEFIFIIGIIITLQRENKFNINKYILIIFGCIILVSAILNSIKSYRNLIKLHDITKPYIEIREYCEKNKDKNYFYSRELDFHASIVFKENMSTTNLTYMGCWLNGSPLAKEKMVQWGGKDAGEVLYYKNNSYCLFNKQENVEWLNTYLNNRFGKCQLEIVDTIKCSNGIVFNVYQISR